VTNALALDGTELITVVKCFIVQAVALLANYQITLRRMSNKLDKLDNLFRLKHFCRVGGKIDRRNFILHFFSFFIIAYGFGILNEKQFLVIIFFCILITQKDIPFLSFYKFLWST